MSRLKECIAKVRGVLTEAEEEFILNAAKESNIRDSVEAANYGINAFYKMLHDDLNALKKSLGLEEVPYPDFVLENDMAAKEAKPKAPSLSLLKRAEKAKRIKELTRAFQLVAQYNELKKEEKASIRGLKIMRELQDEAAKINADLYFSRRGATLKEKTGAVIKDVSKKNTQMSIAERKNKEEIYKKAMAMNPVDIAHSIALDVISGVVFSLDSFKRYTRLSPKEIKTVPKFRVNNGYDSVDLDLYSVKYKENAGETQYSDPDEIANMATEELEKYLSPGGRERAIELVLQKYLESVEAEKNENLSESQLKYLEELQDESNELEKIIEDIESERELLLKDENTILEAQEAEIRDAIEIDKLNDDLNNLLNLEYARESAQAQINKEIEEKLNKGEITPQEAEQAYFYQKKNETKKVGNINKVVSIIRKAMPKVIIEFDTNLVDEDGLPAAGRAKGNVLTINPDYASLDTPIHEAAHILIDAIGYNNKVIQAAIAELKDTDLWKETKKAYSNLNEEMLGKEVLAEAIGREGADIFETESQKSKFKAMLSYIFDRLKRLFGIEKNVAKSLAKQIIAGIGTKNLKGVESKKVSLQMPSGEYVDGKVVMPEVVDGFYSNLEKQLLQMKVDKLPAKQWNDKLKGEEAKWTGLNDWLVSKNSEVVTRADIKKFLKENRIQIVEVVKDENNKSNSTEDLIRKKAEENGLDIDFWDEGEVLVYVPGIGRVNYNDVKTAYDRKFLAEGSEIDQSVFDAVKEIYDLNRGVAFQKRENAPRFKEYQLGGKSENYKEVLITMPSNKKRDDLLLRKEKLTEEYYEYLEKYFFSVDENVGREAFKKTQEITSILESIQKDLDFYNTKAEKTKFDSSHFDEPNILVHLRMNTRTDINGNKVLFLEEVQSDWGQEGKKKGFEGSKKGLIYDIAKDIYFGKKRGDRTQFENAVKKAKDNNVSEGEISNALDLYGDFTKSKPQELASAPFVTNTNAWTKLGLKYALRHAIEEGAKSIAWTTGEQQNNRYNLSKQVDLISWERDVDGTYSISAEKNGSTLSQSKGLNSRSLEETIGKDAAQKIIDSENDNGFLEGDDLKVGGKGMTGFYGSIEQGKSGIVGDVAKALVKELTGKPVEIGTTEIEVGDKTLTQPSIEITPELAKSVSSGMPQYAKRKPLSPLQQQVKDLVDAIEQEENLSAIPFEELLDVYNSIESLDIPGKTKYLKGIKTRIAMNIFEREKVELAKDKEFSAERAAVKDISVRDIKFKVLSHFTNDFPELRFLSDVWDAAFFNRTKEAKEGKRTNEKLALEVIKERRARLGLGQRAFEFAESLFTNINYKFFDYLDAGNGKIITLNEAKKKNLSKAQIEYLKFVRDLIATRKELLNQPDIYNMDMEVLKLDKGFYESYKNEGFAQAYGYWLSSSENLRQAKIMFTNPITGKTSEVPYEVAESVLIKYGEKGAVEKAKSLALILKYNFAARRKKSDLENKQRGTYYLDDNGQLQSKFNRKRPDDAPYSKDFYKAVTEFIDDSAHIKHISPLMPVIESIEYLNNNGVYEYDDEGNKVAIHAEKPNVVKWLDEWKDLHILRQKRTELGPELDSGIKFLRFMTSATTMMFNVPAAIINVAIGNYNIWRAENNKVFGTGLKRLFGGERKFTKDYGYGFVNPIAVDIAKKYGAVSTDIDSNPIQTAGGIMSKLGHAMTRLGEFQIQASGLLGLMSDEDYNSFEYAKNKFGVDELVFKKSITEEKKRAIEKRILKHINRVSDIQGKYSEKDRRNIQNTELGKAIMQFKVYLPDYWRMRFGREEGSFNIMLRTGLKELRADIKKNGLKKGLWDNQSKEAIAFMSNLKGAAAVTFFMILAHSNDDDDDDSVTANAQKMLSNLLGVFDPEQLKFTITHPIAAMGIVDKFLTAVEHLAFWDEASYNKAKTKYGEKGDAKIVGDIIGLTPGKKVADMFIDDEN